MENAMSTAKRAGRYFPAIELAIAILLFAIASATIGRIVAQAAVPVPVPTVTGPIAAAVPAGDPSRDYPYSATVDDLKKYGYVEEEFFFEGAANRYALPPGATGSVVDANHHFKSRLIVRRPSSPAAFNGTAIVEWNNVTPGHDLDIDWLQSHDYWMRSGYVWVGVSAQRVGVEALKVWNARRYSSLDVTDGGRITTDDLSYDVFAQAAQAVRTPAGASSVQLLGGLRVQRLFATGHSQSASRLANYVNSVHPLAPIFDAVVVHGGGGRIRDDLGSLKVWKLLAETDVILSQAAVRQPDSANFRTWEVAGGSHVDQQFVASSRKLSARDGNPVAPGITPGGNRGSAAGPTAAGTTTVVPTPPSQPPTSRAGTTGTSSPCDRPPYSHVAFHHVMNAAFDHLQRWVKDGTLPPAAPRIEISAAGPPATIVRDERGNALGGIRLAEHAVPTGVNTGQNSGPGFCRLNGSHTDFDAATLATLYPTHAAYVTAVRAAVEQNLKAGYILKADADATTAAAEASTVGAQSLRH
jgi:hypothetical protein